MDHIWSPWRMDYISREKKPSAKCIFCHAADCSDNNENLIVRRAQLAYVILNRYPYTSGHVMVVPYAHKPSLASLEKLTLAEIMQLINESLRTIEALYNPEGFNVGANIGSIAGAGVAEHVHFHVVPRWGGDTNFMTAVGGTRVLPEELCKTYERMKAGWLSQE